MENEVSLYDYWTIIKKRKSLIFKIMGGIVFLALLYVILAPNQYTAKTSFYYPLSSGTSASGILGKLGKLGGLASLASSFLSGPSLQNYTKGILESRTIADKLIRKYNLLQYFHTKYWQIARNDLRKSSSIRMNKEGIIVISTTTKNPKLSADLANDYVNAFKEYASGATFSVAQKHRRDVRRQLLKLKKKLHQAEKAMVQFQAHYKTADFTAEAKLYMDALITLKVKELADIMGIQTAETSLAGAKKILLTHYSSSVQHPLVGPDLRDPVVVNLRQELARAYVKYAQDKAVETPQNPQLKSDKWELQNLERTLQKQLKRQMRAAQTGTANSLLLPEIKLAELKAKKAAAIIGIQTLDQKFKTYPTIGLHYLRLERNLKVMEALDAFLSTDYEKAVIQEEKEKPDIQVLDKASIPELPSGPHRLLDLAIGILLGGFLGIGAAFFVESFKPPVLQQLPVEENGKTQEPVLESVKK